MLYFRRKLWNKYLPLSYLHSNSSISLPYLNFTFFVMHFCRHFWILKHLWSISWKKCKLIESLTFVFWYFRPQTWQKRHRRQHQFSHCSSWGRSVSPKQKRWKGSQHTWQKTNWRQQTIRTHLIIFFPSIHETGITNKRQPTSTLPLLAQRKHTTGGVIGTEVRMLSPPISHTFSMS